MAMTKYLDKGIIIKCGILPLYDGMPADHRGFYVDLDSGKLFSNSFTDASQLSFERFNTNQVKNCNKYLYLLEAMLEENRIMTKVDKLEKQMITFLQCKKGNLAEMIAQCKNLFNKTTELMLASDKKSGRAHYT